MHSSTDELFMQAALAEAEKALAQGEVPIGAVLVSRGQVIAAGCNSPIGLHDPTAHAEIVTLRQAGRKMGNYRLPEAELFVTVEPCIMCMGALVQARVKRLVFGTPDPRAGAAGTIWDFSRDGRLNHSLEVTAGVLEERCRTLMQEFFRSRR